MREQAGLGHAGSFSGRVGAPGAPTMRWRWRGERRAPMDADQLVPRGRLGRSGRPAASIAALDMVYPRGYSPERWSRCVGPSASRDGWMPCATCAAAHGSRRASNACGQSRGRRTGWRGSVRVADRRWARVSRVFHPARPRGDNPAGGRQQTHTDRGHQSRAAVGARLVGVADEEENCDRPVRCGRTSQDP